jgi:hypothetical protein
LNSQQLSLWFWNLRLIFRDIPQKTQSVVSSCNTGYTLIKPEIMTDQSTRTNFPDAVISFNYDGKNYSGKIMSSINSEGTYHWFVTEEEDLKSKLGDTIAFKVNEGGLQPVYFSSTHLELMEVIQKVVSENVDW